MGENREHGHYYLRNLNSSSTATEERKYALIQLDYWLFYRFEGHRLQSFYEYKSTTWCSQFLEPHKLAAAGFYYIGKKDIVRCYDCNVQLGFWRPGDNPWKAHIQAFNKCRHICNIPCGNVPIDVNSEDVSLEGVLDGFTFYKMTFGPFRSNPVSYSPVFFANLTVPNRTISLDELKEKYPKFKQFNSLQDIKRLFKRERKTEKVEKEVKKRIKQHLLSYL